jgi:prepilin-type N-terminal cleavage/methylation domain-containing protein/prepilin-type processing-associated H-X9-DG protein
MAYSAPTPALAFEAALRDRRSGFGARGFTVVELLVVVSVIGVMAALLLPALSKTKEHARATVCRSHMKQLALSFLLYAEDNAELLPWPGGLPGRANKNPNYDADWCAGGQNSIDPNLSSSWYVPGFGFNAECGSVYPYVMSQPRRVYDPNFKEDFPVYRCPSTGPLGQALRVNFSANAWTDPGKPFGKDVIPSKGLTTAMIVDPSRKIMLVNEDPKAMLNSAFLPGGTKRTSVFHMDRANLAFMDSHVESQPSKVFRQMQGKDADIYFNCGK